VTSAASPPVRRLQEALVRLAGQTLGRPLTGRTHQDADDITGTVLTDDATGFDPLPLLRTLDLSGARVVVIGQVAFRLPKVLFRTATASGDCCTPALPWGSLPVMDFIDRCEMTSAGEFMIRYVSRRDLIVMRQAAGRVKDLRRAHELHDLPDYPT
jgi:hypothetical protein